MERVDRVIAISTHTKRDLIERWGVKEDRIDVILWGVDPEVFSPQGAKADAALRARLSLPERYFLFIGPFDPWCDPSKATRAFAKIAKDYPDAGLVFAGSRGACADSVEKVAADEGIAERLHWTGHVPQKELCGLYSAASALSFTSFYEGFGLPVLESMAAGTPVITSDVTSLPEVAGDAGLLVDPDSVDAIAEAMKTVLDGDAGPLVEKGLARARAFTWESTAKKTLEVYRSVL